MIEIKADLSRADSGTYGTGEFIECYVEFVNKSDDSITSEDGPCENLAWATAQIHCYRKTKYQMDKVSDIAEHLAKTSLDAVTQLPGDVIIATKPTILFCDLSLKPKESRTYMYMEELPRNGPPTYCGHDIKYFYKVTIATQRVASKVHTLQVPLRVLPVPIITGPNMSPCPVEAKLELMPINPFVKKGEVPELEISWHHVKNLTARRSPKFYRISNKRGFVAEFHLFKPCFKLGEDIIGSLDFNDGTVTCVQFSVKLQSEEISLYNGTNSAGAGASCDASSSLFSFDITSVSSGVTFDHYHVSSTSSNAMDSDADGPTGKLTTHATNHQYCFAILETHISVPIPLHATPSFRTDLVEVKWRLHFEFVTTNLMDFGMPESGEISAPSEVPIETMIWDLPITVFTANPTQMSTPCKTQILCID